MIENSPTKPTHGRQEDTALAELLSIFWVRYQVNNNGAPPPSLLPH